MNHDFKYSHLAAEMLSAIKSMEQAGYITLLVVMGKQVKDAQGNDEQAFRTIFRHEMAEQDRLMVIRVAFESSQQFEKGLEGTAKKEQSKFGMD